MKKIYLVLIFVIFTSNICYAGWFSETDMKYITEYPELGIHFKKASQYLDDWGGQYNRLLNAEKLLDEILKEEPNFAPVYVQYNRLLFKKIQSKNNGILQRREQLLLKAIEIEPNYARAFVNLADVYRLMERYDEAEIFLKRAEKTGIKIPFLKYIECRLYDSQGKFEEGYKKCMECIAENPNYKRLISTVLSYVNMHYNRKGDLKQIDISYRKQIELEPNNAMKWDKYARFLLFQVGDYESAIEKAEKAFSIMDYRYARITLACALYTKWADMLDKDIYNDESSRVFEQAQALEPNLDEVVNTFGRWGLNDKTKLASEKLKSMMEKTDSGLPDLQITLDCPSKINIDDKIIKESDITVTVKNQGTHSASDIGIDLVLSSDTEIPIKYAVFSDVFKEDMLISGGRAGIKYLEAGQSVDVTFGVGHKIPKKLSRDSFYLGVVVDPGNKVIEINENNNVDYHMVEIF